MSESLGVLSGVENLPMPDAQYILHVKELIEINTGASKQDVLRLLEGWLGNCSKNPKKRNARYLDDFSLLFSSNGKNYVETLLTTLDKEQREKNKTYNYVLFFCFNPYLFGLT